MRGPSGIQLPKCTHILVTHPGLSQVSITGPAANADETRHVGADTANLVHVVETLRLLDRMSRGRGVTDIASPVTRTRIGSCERRHWRCDTKPGIRRGNCAARQPPRMPSSR